MALTPHETEKLCQMSVVIALSEMAVGEFETIKRSTRTPV